MLNKLGVVFSGLLASFFALGISNVRGDETICTPLSSGFANVLFDASLHSGDRLKRVSVTVPRRVGEFHFDHITLRVSPRHPTEEALGLFVPRMPVSSDDHLVLDPEDTPFLYPDEWRKSDSKALYTSFYVSGFHRSTIKMTATFYSEPPECVSHMEIPIFPQLSTGVQN